MRNLIIKNALVLFVLLYMQNAMAGSAFYTAVVTAEKAGIVDRTDISAPSHHACEFRKGDVIANYIATGYTIINASSCTAINLRIPELIKPEWLWQPRWPVPPVCLRCPPWDLNVLNVLDPILAKQVNELSEKYRVDEYLKELQNLQEQFDLQGFDKALEELDAQQQFN